MADTSSRTYSWKELVQETEGEKLQKKPVTYEFNGGKKVFREQENSGVYETEE